MVNSRVPLAKGTGVTRNCYGSGATIWVAPDETARCPQCQTPATVYRHSLGGGYRVVADHLVADLAFPESGEAGPMHLLVRRIDGRIEPAGAERQPSWTYDDET